MEIAVGVSRQNVGDTQTGSKLTKLKSQGTGAASAQPDCKNCIKFDQQLDTPGDLVCKFTAFLA